MANATIFQAPQIVNVVEDNDFDILTPKVYNNAIGRKPEPVLAKFSDDPIALSIQSYLIWKSNPHRRWVPVDEVGRVTSEARAMAQELRTYFLHRNTMKVLQGQTPTEFQYKMNGLLTDIRPLPQDELGLLYRLPYFWQEDLALDQVFEGATDVEATQAGPGLPIIRHMTIHARLTPVREVLRSRKSGDFVQFWFSDSEGQRHVYAVRADNSMISLFRSLFKRESIQVKAHAMLNRLAGSHIRTSYWKLSGLELE
jgi:hypothetical protein